MRVPGPIVAHGSQELSKYRWHVCQSVLHYKFCFFFVVRAKMTGRAGIACFMYSSPKVRANKKFDSFEFCLD